VEKKEASANQQRNRGGGDEPGKGFSTPTNRRTVIALLCGGKSHDGKKKITLLKERRFDLSKKRRDVSEGLSSRSLTDKKKKREGGEKKESRKCSFSIPIKSRAI